MIRALALAATLAGCDPGTARVSGDECEALLAHLLVLERDALDPHMCKYHAHCDGSERAQYVAQCPRVVSRRELGCYQRATELRAAEACLPLAELDERIASGEIADVADAGETQYGWSLQPNDQRAVMLGELERIRDAACACADPACLMTIGDRVDAWMSRFSTLQGDAGSAAVAQRLFHQVEDCRSGKRGALDGGMPNTLLPNCSMYILLLEKMASCSALPQSTRDSLRDSLPSLRDAYDGANMSDDVREQMDASCAQALPSLRDQLRTTGCP